MFDQGWQPYTNSNACDGKPTGEGNTFRNNVQDYKAGDGDKDETVESRHHMAGNTGRTVDHRAEGQRHETESQECKVGQSQENRSRYTSNYRQGQRIDNVLVAPCGAKRKVYVLQPAVEGVT